VYHRIYIYHFVRGNFSKFIYFLKGQLVKGVVLDLVGARNLNVIVNRSHLCELIKNETVFTGCAHTIPTLVVGLTLYNALLNVVASPFMEQLTERIDLFFKHRALHSSANQVNNFNVLKLTLPFCI
jgi:hypothetical protein